MEAARTGLVAEPGLEHGADRRTPNALAARLTVPARTRRDRRVGIALGAVAIVGATPRWPLPRRGALPGDALYPVKRVIERTEAGCRPVTPPRAARCSTTRPTASARSAS